MYYFRGMLEGLIVEQVGPQLYDHIRSVYDASNYKGGILPEDRGILATLNGVPVGGVRLTHEHGVLMLRGMMVKPGYQRQGIGKAMLEVLDKYIANNSCYLVGRVHLQSFYGSIGFETITSHTAPQFIAERVKKYNEESLKCVIMYRRDRS